MEEEIPRRLEQAGSPPERLGDLLVETFGPAGGTDLELPQREPHDPIDLGHGD